jgi:hypothetical protein
MNERLLQFIWQFQYYNPHALYTTEGEPLLIEKPGAWNHHQGPDFSEAIIRIGSTRWVGNIELHLRSSDWEKHRHSADDHYSNIILHVVWQDDQPLHGSNGVLVPTLELQHRIPRLLLERYQQMMQTVTTVPCQGFLPGLQELAWRAWKERLVAERLIRRSEQVLQRLEQAGHHWEEVCWQMLASGFGMKVNSVLFEQVAFTLPVNLLSRHRTQIHHLEALLLGQANLLNGRFTDNYSILLQREYRFLKKKYQLRPVGKQPAFLRMRPAAFPTVRLAQLAMLLHRTTAIFATLKEATDPGKILDIFMVTANDYWHYHYRFDEETKFQPKHLGRQMAENIMVNTVIPVLFAYGLYTKDESYRERAIQWLYGLAAEQNRITRGWQQSGITHSSALDSQALIELTNHYCINRRCLECAVGNRILKNGVL